MWSQVLLLIACLALLAVLVAWVAGTFEAKVPAGQQPPASQAGAGGYATTRVAELRQPVIVEAIGKLIAARRVDVASKLMAEVAAVHVRAGDRVSVGDVLVELKSADEEARVRQAREALAAAAARREKADNDLERHKELLAGQAVTQARFDAIESTALAARAEEQRARQALTEARTFLGYATIRAPQAGRVVERRAEPGDVVQPGVPVLTLYDPNSLRLEAPVAERMALQLRPGNSVRVYIDALGRELPGQVDEIVPRARPHSRTVLVKATVDRSAGLYEGLVGRLRVQADQRRLLCVSRDALQTLGQLQFVRVQHADGRIERRFVKTGAHQPCPAGRVEILSGLTAGETVLIDQPKQNGRE